ALLRRARAEGRPDRHGPARAGRTPDGLLLEQGRLVGPMADLLLRLDRRGNLRDSTQHHRRPRPRSPTLRGLSWISCPPPSSRVSPTPPRTSCATRCRRRSSAAGVVRPPACPPWPGRKEPRSG